MDVDAATTLRDARRRADMTLRELAAAAGTSHSALAAYESGAKTPNVATFLRVIRAAGFAPDIALRRRHHGTESMPRGEELEAVLRLAAEFPARHAPTLEAPVFPRLP